MASIDLNADVGEGFGVYGYGCDEALLGVVSSANIACGFHAGDPATMRRTVRLAQEHGVAMGAHPGLPDRGGFGRREMEISPPETYDLVLYQVGALQAFVSAAGGVLRHVKPHGALYNMAAKRPELAMAVAGAVHAIDPKLILVGLAGSRLIEAGQEVRLLTASEAFADRTYQDDGSLTPRSNPAALVTDRDQAVRQALGLAQYGQVQALSGRRIDVSCDTIGIHGDTPGAVEFARKIREALEAAGIIVQRLATRHS